MSGNNSKMHKARKVKNDEFYTQLTDIEKELKHYKNKFKNKVVLCNCDDPYESNFVKYFSLKFEDLGLKRLVATHYIEAATKKKRKPYKLEYLGDKDGDNMPDPEEFTYKMIGDGDFRSPECIELLKEADIVVTNPPFSLFREYVAQLMEYKKKFLIIGHKGAVIYKEIFPLIKNNQIWLGYTSPKEFGLPDGTITKRVAGLTRWFTNLDHKKFPDDLKLYKKYNKKDYPKFDGYDVINISKVSDIPMDYPGVMGVPITFLDWYNPDQFEILGIAGNVRWIDYECYTIIKGKSFYERLMIRNKRLEE